MLNHVQPAARPGPYPLGTFPTTLPQAVVLHEVVVTQGQILALDLVELHTIGLGPLVQIPLQSLLTLKPCLRGLLKGIS